MPGTGGLGQVVALPRKTSGQNTRLGRAFVLMGALAFVGGGLLLALAETVQVSAADQWTYRAGAGILVGVALPALLHGLVILADPVRPVKDTSDIGILVCVLAAGVLLGTGTEAPRYVDPALLIYGLGVLACVFAVSGALSAGDDATATPDDRIDTSDDEVITPDDETRVLLEDPPAN